MPETEQHETRMRMLNMLLDGVHDPDFNVRAFQHEEAVAFLVQTVADYGKLMPPDAVGRFMYIAMALYKGSALFASGEAKAEDATDSFLDSLVKNPLYRV